MAMNWPPWQAVVRRVEPQILSAPPMYGSPGEPGMYSSPTIAGNMPPVQFVGASAAPLLALLAGGALMARSGGLDRETNRRETSGTIRQAEDVMPDEMGFGKAFSTARRMKLKEFTWRGRRFTTKLAKEVKDVR